MTDNFTLEARYDYALNENSGGTALEIVDCPPVDVAPAGQCARSITLLGDFDDVLDGQSGAGYMDTTDVEHQEAALTGTLQLGWADLIFTTGYQEQTSELDLEQANFPVTGPLGVDAILPAVVNEDFEQFSQEVRLQSSGNGPLSYMVGLYYEDSELNVNSAIGFFQAGVGAFAAPELSATDLVVQAADATQNSETWSGFASVSYDLTEKLTVSGGLRYSDVTKTAVRDGYFGTIQPFPAGTQPQLLDLARVSATADAALGARLGGTAPFSTAKLSADEWMPSANVTYRLAEDATLYASYAHGFKAGGFNLSRSSDTFDPETADAYEMGLKSTWLDHRLMTNLAVFWSDYYDLQEAGVIYSSTGTPLSFIGNVASSRARGVELETSYAATADLTFNASLSYLESQYVDYSEAPCSPYQTALGVCSSTMPGDLSGHTKSNAPKWSGRVAMDYEHPLTDNWTFQFNPSVYFRTKYYLQSLPEDLTSQDGFVKVDLRAALNESNGNRSLALIVHNLFGEETYSFAGHAPTGPGSTQKIIDRGRVVGIQLSFNY
ncbi:MAG: TonB-dependent receptor [Hyphomonas sp.]|nr:TonB-dependent receptor [Hyphomonas sp.]